MADTNNGRAFDRARYLCFRRTEKRPDGTIAVFNMPYCFVILDGDTAESGFWMVPSPVGGEISDGSLADNLAIPLNIEIQEIPGTNMILPDGSDKLGTLGVFGWSDPSV